MSTGDAVQVFIAIVLAITMAGALWYAWEARKQAEASTEMADEAKLSRIDDSRPVLDLRHVHTEEHGMGQEAMTHASEDLWSEIYVRCRLVNVGRGPALNISASAIYLNDQVNQGDFGTLADTASGDSCRLAVVDDQLEVRYQDVFGRWFYSQRGVSFGPGGPKVGVLRVGEMEPGGQHDS